MEFIACQILSDRLPGVILNQQVQIKQEPSTQAGLIMEYDLLSTIDNPRSDIQPTEGKQYLLNENTTL